MAGVAGWFVWLAAYALAAQPGGISPRDLGGFPPRHVAEFNRDLAGEHLLVADARVLNCPGCPWARAVRRELLWRHRAWSALCGAHCLTSEFWVVMELMALVDALGPDAYRLRLMPHPLPLHLYADVSDAPVFRPLLEEEAPAPWAPPSPGGP